MSGALGALAAISLVFGLRVHAYALQIDRTPAAKDEPVVSTDGPVAQTLGQSARDPGPSVEANPEPETSPFVVAQPHPVPPFPILLNQSVQRCMSELLDHSEMLQDSFDRSRPYMGAMMRELRDHGLPDDLVFLSFAESAFSRAGKGPWQFTKPTAKRYGLKIDGYVDERRDPIYSTRAAAEYLAELHDAAGYDWRLALIGWNAGEYTIERYWSLRGQNYDRMLSRLPYRTRRLLSRFMAVAFIARNGSAYGITPASLDDPPAYREVEVKGGTRLSRIAALYATTVTRLRELNPSLLRDQAPPYQRAYTMRIPAIASAAGF